MLLLPVVLVGAVAFAAGAAGRFPTSPLRGSAVAAALAFPGITGIAVVLNGDGLDDAVVGSAAWTFTVMLAAPLGARLRRGAGGAPVS
jgi:hypothetical protein